MWRLYRPLFWFWWVIVVVVAGDLILGVLGNCAYEALSPAGCELLVDFRDLTWLWVGAAVLFLLVLGGLTLATRPAYLRHEAAKGFALVKDTKRLIPEDLGFQLLAQGRRPDPHQRPFYPTYTPRVAVDNRSGEEYGETELAERLDAGTGFVLLGEPLSGKSRSLYEILRRAEDYVILAPFKEPSVLDDGPFSVLFGGKRIILLLDDLSAFVASGTPLPRIAEALERHAIGWVVAATCGDGPELNVIKAEEGTGIGRFYGEHIPLKLELRRLQAEEKVRLARSVGKVLSVEGSGWYPTPGSIAMEESTEAMRRRFENALTSEQRDVLRSLKLLAYAGVQPFTHQRIRATAEGMFGRRDLHLRDCLDVLGEQAFVRRPAPKDPVRPEPAYLRDAVAYVEGKAVAEDFPELKGVLEESEDHRGLLLLGLTYGNVLQDNESALDCFERATVLSKDFLEGFYNKGVALENLGCPEDALRAFQKTVDLEDNYPEAWNNIASVRNGQGEYRDALQAARKAVALNPDLPEAYFNEGVALGGRGDDQGALSAYDKAILLRPAFAEAWANRSAALHALNLDGPAVKAAKTAIRYDPNLAIAWFRRGVALAMWPGSDRRRAALLAFCKALELDPQYHAQSTTCASHWSTYSAVQKG